MAQTPSQMLQLGTKAPDFNLPDPDGNLFSRDELAGSNGLLVMFICNHCPFVKHVAGELAKIGDDYQGKGIGIAAINSNDVENYPDDAPPKMNQFSRQHGFSFPYLFDESQEVAKAYKAACTPDFYLFDENLNLVYRGQLDDSRPKNDEPLNGKDLRAAMDSMVAGRPVPEDQKPSIGCNIKWKSGNTPEYA